MWFYFRSGSFRLDPTHVREYRSVDEFVKLVAGEGFEIVRIGVHRVEYPVLDLVVRLLIRLGFVEPDPSFLQRHKRLWRIRKLNFSILGYRFVEVLARKS